MIKKGLCLGCGVQTIYAFCSKCAVSLVKISDEAELFTKIYQNQRLYRRGLQGGRRRINTVELWRNSE